MLNLIKNEYIKLFKRGSVIAAVIVMFVLSLGIMMIFKAAEILEDELTYMTEDGEVIGEGKEFYEARVTVLKERLEELEKDSKSNTKDMEAVKRSIAVFEYLIEKDISEEDWRYSLVFEVIGNKEEKDEDISKQEVKEFLDNNDFEGYVRYKAQVTKDQEIKYVNCDDGIKNIYAFMVENEIFDSSDWRYEALTNLEAMAQNAASDREIKRVMALNYRILNNIQYSTDDIVEDIFEVTDETETPFMYGFGSSAGIMVILCGIVIIFAGIIVASEHTDGTIKFLITNPVSRGKIIVSKYLTIVSLSAIGMVTLFVFNFIVCCILFGTEGINAVHLKVTMDGITQMPVILNILIKYVLEMVGVIAYGTMAFAISSFAKSTAVAVAVGIMSSMAGSMVSTVLAQMHQDWGRYLIFSNTSLSTIMENGAYYPNQSVTFALTTVVVYVIIFFTIAYDGFTRKEI
ncbi:MAG: ABC transporter permease subunit [Lachnospiraceae bacterium]|nr:ABC transporter permease subunit [Lachnospiraceae bacterium]